MSRVSRVMAPSKLVKKARKDARKDPAAAHQLAQWYVRGEEGLGRDHSSWLRWETEAGERGCVDAQFVLGCARRRGDMGLGVNLVVAAEWFQKAALQGHVLSAFNLGASFERGDGVEVNLASAAQWYRKAASQGHVVAMVSLGILLAEGRPGMEQDCQAAAELFREAIERGSVDGLWSMGVMYHHKAEAGEGVFEENLAMALSFWQRAADLGHEDAAGAIGDVYWSGGNGYEKSLKLAKKYTRVSAAQGNEEAIAALKLMTACAQCGTGGAPGVCAGCKQVHYCNKECQLKHWCNPLDPHMPHCNASKQSPIAAEKKVRNCRACAACGAHNAKMLCSDCLYEGDPRRKVR